MSLTPAISVKIEKIKKRDGRIDEFDPKKITAAIHKAFIATHGEADHQRLEQITGKVVAELQGMFSLPPEGQADIPGVEQVQDVVEKALMSEGFFDVAKRYIIYRHEHAKRREEKKKDLFEKIEKNEISVVKRSGALEQFSLEKLKRSIAYAARGLEKTVDIEAIALRCRAELYEGMSTKDIANALTITTRSFIEHDPSYQVLAAKLLRSIICREVIGAGVDFANLDKQYREAFARNIRKGVEDGKLDKRLLEFDLEKLGQALAPERDELFIYMGMNTIYGRYLLRDGKNQLLETPQAMWMRIAMGLSLLEKDKVGPPIRFYEAMSTLRYIPSTPTLFHSGFSIPQLSSCYISTVGDSLFNIFKCIGDNAQMAKWSGGIGNDWTNLRAAGSPVKGTFVESNGVIPFLKIASDTTVTINRSGRRRGATCVYLENWHLDFEEFMQLRKNTGDERRRTPDLDTAAWISDLFMKRVLDNGDWTMFSPNDTPDLHSTYGRKFEERYQHYEKLADGGKIGRFRQVKARELWKKMLSMLYETGHPWITFKDPCNIRSPQDHAGVVNSSNLCTEITLNTSPEETAVCNLGSINLSKHIKDKKLDAELVKETVETAIRMLDNVIDVNFYPTSEARVSNLRHRPIGLGVMGFQDALYLMDIQFDSPACVEFADHSMELISYHAILSSSKLAAERGTYESYNGSKWDRGIFPIDTIGLLEAERGEKIEVPKTNTLDWEVVREHVKKYGMRNSNCMAIAPTATISNIAGCVPSIEPIYKNLYVKSNVSGDFTVINSYLVEELKKYGLWDFEMLAQLKFHDGSVSKIPQVPQKLKEKYKEAFDIDPHWILLAAAYRGKWIDQSQSVNIFFAGASGKKLDDTYTEAWKLGLKTTYYLRTLAASQVEKSTINPEKYGSTHTRQAVEQVKNICRVEDASCESCQ